METKENYIIVRVKDTIKVLFEEDFIGGQFRTQNALIETLQLLYGKNGDFQVLLCTRELEELK